MELTKETEKIAETLYNKKADDIVLLDVRGLTIVADYFVVAGASNENHVRSLTDEVEQKMGEAGFVPARVEGATEGRWVVIDYGDVLVHIFHKKEREFYQLERLWKTNSNFLDYSKERQGSTT